MKKIISLTLAVLMLLSLAACGSGKSGGNKETVVGNAASDGYSLYVQENTFSDKAEIKVASSDSSNFDRPDKFELIGTPLEVSCDEYDGFFFGTDVALTVQLPESVKNEDEEFERYFFVWSNESGDIRYLEPDTVNAEDRTMTVTLPHFSLWGAAKLTPEEEINLFLDSYCTKLAVAELGYEQTADQLGPYVQAKIDALNLTEEAAEELKKAVIKELGGMAFDDFGELGAAAYNSKEEDGYQEFTDELDGKITEGLTNMLSQLGASKAAALFNSSNKTSKIAGYLAGGDTESAMKEVGSLMEDAIPMGSVVSKAVGYVGAKVNECFTNWKANEVEELYQIYKNGASDFWHNEVVPGDWDSMSVYLNDSSGFTKAKAVNRFYNLDKVGEICKKYGWPYSNYEDLPDKYKEIFNKRAEEGLKNYFEARLAQEKEVERLKAEEEAGIKDMLGIGGALRSGWYTEFFGEETKGDYSLTDRLNRLVNVRSFISQFVDEAALAQSAKDGGLTCGSLLNKWVSLYNDNLDNRDVVIKDFTQFLKEEGLLNPLYVPAPEIDGIDAFMGDWHYTNDGYTYDVTMIRSGDNVIVADLNLPWYDDISCTEYKAEFDESTLTLKLTGITSWVGDPSAEGSGRRLEIDASIVSSKYTATEVADGKVVVMTNGYNEYVR